MHDVLVEEQSHLVFRVGGEVVGRGVVEMTELTVTDLIKAALVELRLYTRHQIDPEGNFRAVEGCLLDDTLCTEGEVGSDDIICLVGCVAEEVALENGLGAGELCTQGVVGVQDGLKLLGIGQSWISDMYNRLIFPDLGAIIKADDLPSGVFKLYT